MQLQVAEEQTEVGGKSSVRAVYSLCKEVDTMSFGENLQLIRKKNQLSQEGLAEMLGVSRQAVSKWELGEGYPEVDKRIRLLPLSQTQGQAKPGRASFGRDTEDTGRKPLKAAKTAPNSHCLHPTGTTCPCGERRTRSLRGTETWKTLQERSLKFKQPWTQVRLPIRLSTA